MCPRRLRGLRGARRGRATGRGREQAPSPPAHARSGRRCRTLEREGRRRDLCGPNPLRAELGSEPGSRLVRALPGRAPGLPLCEVRRGPRMLRCGSAGRPTAKCERRAWKKEPSGNLPRALKDSVLLFGVRGEDFVSLAPT